LPLVAHRRLARSATDPPHLSPSFCSSCFSMSPPISCSCSSPGKLLAPVSASSMSLLSLSCSLSCSLSLALSLSLSRSYSLPLCHSHTLSLRRACACVRTFPTRLCTWMQLCTLAHVLSHANVHRISTHVFTQKYEYTHVLAHAYLHTCAPRNADYRLGFRIWGTGHRGWGLGFSWTTG